MLPFVATTNNNQKLAVSKAKQANFNMTQIANRNRLKRILINQNHYNSCHNQQQFYASPPSNRAMSPVNSQFSGKKPSY